MKNVCKVLGVIALAASIALSMDACNDGSTDKHLHSYSETWSSNGTQHWKECSCGNKTEVANHTGELCTVCGFDSHIHSYSKTWSSNGTQHWKECSCGNKTEVANHTGELCTVCGFDSKSHVHSYSETWSSNGTQHWKECLCSDKTEVANHTGELCAVCGYVSHSHVHSYSETWSSNGTQHWKECLCGDKTEVANHTPGTAATCTTAQTCTVCSAVIIPAPGHTWGNDAVTEPTCISAGYTTQTCTVCFDPNTAAVREITITMRDSGGDGWDGNGALRINVNGTDLPQNARLAGGSSGNCTFTASTGDEVKIYWIAGTYQSENAFAVYYSDAPPSPAFNPSSSSWSPSNDPDGKVLAYRQYNTMNSISGGTLLGTIIISGNARRINTTAALGHSVEPIAATCIEAGNTGSGCTRTGCDAVITGTTIPVLEHTWGNDAVTEPTCISAGFTTQTCTVCFDPNAAAAAREITITMRDSYGDGWNGNGALRINVNGTDLPQNARLASGSSGNYTFTASTGDEVKIYWIAGSSQSENAFAVYYSDAPPSPAFNPSSGSWSPSNDPDGKVLAYRQYRTMNDISGGTLLGTIIISTGNVRRINTTAALGHTGLTAATAAACTTTGITENGTCTRTGCDAVVTGTTIPALGHDHGTSGSGSLICKREGCNHQYAVGDKGPAGGKIFYVRAAGFTVQGYTGTGGFASYTAYYLEDSPSSEPTIYLWGAYGTLIPDVTTFTSASDSKASLIGNGRRDTQLIVNYLSGTTTNTAAQRCTANRGGGFSDWFLPSLGELNEWGKINVFPGMFGSSGSQYFWSSSQYYNGSAWGIDSSNTPQRDISKNYSGYVHAIRAF